MHELILHHYPTSPFAEKARLMLGYKQLSWRSVEIPRIMPKPDLTALTGGYRKTPVLQVGADIYCDTLLILREIERRHPEPSLYPGVPEGLANALSYWVERTTFVPAAALATSVIGMVAVVAPEDTDRAQAILTARHVDNWVLGSIKRAGDATDGAKTGSAVLLGEHTRF